MTFKAFPIESLSLDNEFQDFSSATVTLYFFAMVDKDSPLFTLCVILTFWIVTAGSDLEGLAAGASTAGLTVDLSIFAGVVDADDGLATDVVEPRSTAFSAVVFRAGVAGIVTDVAAEEGLGSEEPELLFIGRKGTSSI
jgi:hypothetical protein